MVAGGTDIGSEIEMVVVLRGAEVTDAREILGYFSTRPSGVAANFSRASDFPPPRRILPPTPFMEVPR